VWKGGSYATYHRDIFQIGVGNASLPPSRVPDPEFNKFNPYHRTVLALIALRERYAPEHAR